MANTQTGSPVYVLSTPHTHGLQPHRKTKETQLVAEWLTNKDKGKDMKRDLDEKSPQK